METEATIEPPEPLAPHDRRGPADRGDGAEVVDLELLLEIVPADLGDRGEARRQAGGVEEAVQPAELQHRLPEQTRRGWRRPARPPRRRSRARETLPPAPAADPARTLAVQVRHHHVGALLGKALRRRSPMPLPPPMITTIWRGSSLVRAVPGDLLLDLAALQRPVLELEDVRLGNEFEPVDRLRILDALEHRPVADIRGDRTALVG